MKVLRTISSLFLAILVVFSSTSFTVGVHFCMGEARDVAFFTDATQCEMEQLLPPCHRKHGNTCCDDETIVHDSEDFKPVSSEDHVTAGFLVVTSRLPMPISEIVPSVTAKPVHSLADNPPLPIPDLIVENQVFLI